jgi:hypothetical protein
MKQGKIIEGDFKEAINRSLENTLNYENHTLYEKYDYDEESRQIGSILGLTSKDNFIMNKIIPYLRDNSPLEYYQEKDRVIYENRPMKLSLHKYGVIDFWWILLAVNGYFNPREFHSFEYLHIPKRSDLEVIIDKELYTNKDYGVIPE